MTYKTFWYYFNPFDMKLYGLYYEFMIKKYHFIFYFFLH